MYTAGNEKRPRTLSQAKAKPPAATSMPKASVTFKTDESPPLCWANMRETPPTYPMAAMHSM